jgi:hypothetical protein
MYSSEDEIESVVRGFETCETDKTEFKHRQHLVVAVWYLQTLDTQAAVARMRDGLLRFLDHHGVPREKYNEEVTVFWIELIAEKLSELGSGLSLVERCNWIMNKTDLSSTTRTPASRAEDVESLVRS